MAAVCNSLAMASVGSVVAAPSSAKLSSSNAAFNGSGSLQQLAAPVRSSASCSHSGRVVAVRANLSEEGKKVRRQVLTSLLAAGVALNLAGAAAPVFAASGPGTDGAERTARKAGELLQDADKLIKNDSPPSYGPGRALEGATENIDRLSQQAGAGALPSLQNSGSAAVQDARNKVASNVEKTKRRIDKVFQSKAPLPSDAIGDVRGKVDKTINKVKSGSNSFGSKTNFGSSAKNLVGDAKSKIDEANPSKTPFFGKIRQQAKGLQGAVGSKIEEVKAAVSK